MKTNITGCFCNSNCNSGPFLFNYYYAFGGYLPKLRKRTKVTNAGISVLTQARMNRKQNKYLYHHYMTVVIKIINTSHLVKTFHIIVNLQDADKNSAALKRKTKSANQTNVECFDWQEYFGLPKFKLNACDTGNSHNKNYVIFTQFILEC